MIHPQPVLSRMNIRASEVYEMVPVGLIFIGLVVRAVLGTAVVVAVVWLLYKLGRLAEAYTDKLAEKK